MSNVIKDKFPPRGKAATKRSKFEDLARPFLDHDIRVFPLKTDDKIPLKGSNGFKNATTDPVQIKTWGKQFPNSNLGIPTGNASGIIVVDLDRKSGVDGIKAFKLLCKKLGIKMPGTYRLQTPSGGRHLYFRTKYADRIRNSAGRLGPGIDVRGQGGYVVGQGSSIKGKQYKCIEGALDDIAALPKNLRLAIQAKPETQPGYEADDSIPKGSRNDTLFTSACGFFREGRDHALTLQFIRAINSTCKPPLTDSEVIGLVKSAARYEVPEPDTGEKMLTDMGAARRLAIANEGTLVYVHELGKFFHRVKHKHWQKNPGIEYVLAKKAARALQKQVPKIKDLNLQESTSKFAIRSQSSLLIKHCLKLSQTEPELARSIDQFDSEPWLLPVKNGVIDLRNKSFRKVSAEDYFLNVCPVSYDESAECPLWDAFLKLVQPDRSMRVYLKKLVGLTLVGSAAPELIIFLYGIAGSGKSTFVNAIMKVLGRDLAVKIPIFTLLMRDREGSPNELLPLLGARMAVASEVPEGRKFNEARLKDLASKDILSTRPLYAEAIQFLPSHTLWIYGNHLARVSGSDSGIQRRMCLLPFDQVIPEEKVDRFFEKKLEAELPGILNWSLDGCRAWQKPHSMGKKPKRVQVATDGYLSRMNLMKQFFEERIVTSLGKNERGSEIYSVYRHWAEAQGERPESNTLFGPALELYGVEKGTDNKGSVYYDIRVLRHDV